MDKLIKDIDRVISNNLSYGLFEDMSRSQDIAIFLSYSLRSFKLRCRRRRRPQCDSTKISSSQWRQIDDLVGFASDYWDMLPHDDSSSRTYYDYYRIGFINAVLRVMEIFGIDERRVRK